MPERARFRVERFLRCPPFAPAISLIAGAPFADSADGRTVLSAAARRNFFCDRGAPFGSKNCFCRFSVFVCAFALLDGAAILPVLTTPPADAQQVPSTRAARAPVGACRPERRLCRPEDRRKELRCSVAAKFRLPPSQIGR
ncbi:MAG: hypothetical protein QOE68_1374 [Thermoanaerobaculia bacterium]|nr:hypothetical protein [Thermoanaerobaculia bacterium]